MNLGMAVSLVGAAAFKAVCGAGKVLAGFDSQTFPHIKVNGGSMMLSAVDFFLSNAGFSLVLGVQLPLRNLYGCVAIFR
jgi:hypothetical protein